MNLNQGQNTAVLPEFLAFRRLIATEILKFIFWPAVIIGVYYNAWLTFLVGYDVNWLSITSGILILRLAFECLFLYTYLRKTS